LKKIKYINATKIGAELTIIVELEIEVIVILQCHKVKSIVKAKAAMKAMKIVLLDLTLNIHRFI
jgi:hypothetical protein